LSAVRAPDVVLAPPPPVTAALLERAAALPRDSRDRGVTMACWMVGRLVLLRLATHADRPSAEALRSAVDAVRAWIEALPASTAARPALRRVCAALVGDTPGACADALDGLRTACAPAIGGAGDGALATLAHRCRDASRPSRPEPRP
jgi:hypothetical protein